MPHGLSIALNALVPGCMLALRGRPGFGLLLVAAAVICLSLAVVGAFLAGPAWHPAAHVALLAYLVLAAFSSVALWWRSRLNPIDPIAVRRLHRAAAAAWLRDESAAALTAARTLTTTAASEPGAWRLLELIAHSPADAAIRQQARRCAELLETADR